MGKTIIVSSHILPELADICNKIGIIEKGVMTHNAEVSEVLRKVRENIVLHIQVARDTEQAAKLFESHQLVDDVRLDKDKIIVTLNKDVDDYTELPEMLIAEGFRLKSFSEEVVNLESAFMALTKGLNTKN